MNQPVTRRRPRQGYIHVWIDPERKAYLKAQAKTLREVTLASHTVHSVATVLLNDAIDKSRHLLPGGTNGGHEAEIGSEAPEGGAEILAMSKRWQKKRDRVRHRVWKDSE